MSIISEKIKSAQYIYSANTKWGLKKFVCDVKYFTTEPLDDLFYVICSILDSNEGKCYDKRALGILLGFSMMDQIAGGKHETYFDVAEVRILDDILAKVESEHLITIKEHDIFLTELGHISLKEKKHYQFFSGFQEVYEHTLKSETPTAMLMFPFYKDMGIFTEIRHSKQIWPEDEDVKSIIYFENNQLKKRLELHSKYPSNIYESELELYFDPEVKIVPVQLYQTENEYIPAIFNGETLAIRATELLNEEINSVRKENVVLECLFRKLWDDKNAVFDYEQLQPYFDLVDYEELTKDPRTVWTDNKLFNYIVERSTPTCWRNISHHCDLNVIKEHISKYKEYFDWGALTERIDDKFLIDNFLEFPWDLEVISEDYNRNEAVIEKLILLQKETEEEWNWDELEIRLSQNFVLSHLDIVKVNLASYTSDTPEVRKALLENIDHRWDWNKIESEFDLQFIYNHIAALGYHFGLHNLFDRIFSSPKWADKFAVSESFKLVVEKASKEDGALSSAIFNDRKYYWSENVIDFLAERDLLSWPSTPYMIGFECNPHINWTNSFFKKYSNRISKDGISFVSSQIKDITILIEAPNFDWDWDQISSNENLLPNYQLYTSFGDKLNWRIVFENYTDVSLFQSISDINTMIGEDENAWALFSSIAEIDYVVNTYKELKFPWNWTVLTERMFEHLKLDNLGNKLFIDKWDWTFLSEHINLDFISNNLEKYSKYWNWDVVLPRIFSIEDKFDYDFLDNLAVILTNISGKEKCQKAWSALTSQYSFVELKRIIKETQRKRAYWWDLGYFCLHKDFYVFRDLNECRNFVDWDILSSSQAVDNSFKYNPKLKIKEKAWHDKIRELLIDKNNHWNFKLLSHFESLKDEQWFITQFKQDIDWDYISLSSNLFCEKDKQKLNEIIEAYKKFIRFTILSERSDVDIEQVIKINPKGEYDYNKLAERKTINITLQLVEEMPNYPWDWQMVSSSSSFYPTAAFLLSHLDYDLNWNYLSLQDNNRAWGDEDLILAIAKNVSISSQIDWFRLSSLDYFPLTNSILEYAPLESLNWKRLSSRKIIKPFVDEYAEFIDWTILSDNRHVITLNIDVLDKYKDLLDWEVICKKSEFVYTNDIIERFSNYIDWNLASASHNIKFSKDIVNRYKDKWNWPVLVKNKAFNNTIDISDMPYAKQINIVDFIDRFPRKPMAYHFTHMDNAVKIIRSMKLQCRNFADGNFSNSAGTNVHRTAKAHRFARFYFMPKSPTQFYNECLGKDSDDYKYFKKARNLGLPKCPLPVFFIFDVEELLSVMPDICYYSNGNMQKDSSRFFRVIDNPDRIKAREIYINSYETFEERQQEFLVEGEVDFSKLKNVQICCYDSYQASLLKKELKGTKWENTISVGNNLYERTNKVLRFREYNEYIEISTDYKCPFEFRISYSGTEPPQIINKQNVIRQRRNNIYVSSSIEVNKDTQFEIYFEVNEPRIESWLIYKNL